MMPNSLPPAQQKCLQCSTTIQSSGADQRFNSFRLAIISDKLRPVIPAISSSGYRPNMFNSHCPQLHVFFNRSWVRIPSWRRFARTLEAGRPSSLATSASSAVPSRAMAAGVQSIFRGIQANVTLVGEKARKCPPPQTLRMSLARGTRPRRAIAIVAAHPGSCKTISESKNARPRAKQSTATR